VIGFALSVRIIILRTRKSAIVQIVNNQSLEAVAEEEIRVDINRVIGFALSVRIIILRTRKSAIVQIVNSQSLEAVAEEEIRVDVILVSLEVMKTPI